jgi:siderophore synthetase component
MTPKEKAQDLVNTYRIILMDEDTDCGNELLCTSIAIKNALVAVNEIWNALESARAFEEYDYWNEVKQEIEKL